MLAAGTVALLGGCATSAGEGWTPQTPTVQPSREDYRALALEVYTYAYPLVLTDVARELVAARAPANTLLHRRAFPDPAFPDLGSPDPDALCSIAWLDLSKGPVVLSVPPTGGRFHTLDLMDGWTNVFAALGKRTAGNQRANYAIVAPDWSGALPAGVREIRAPASSVWLHAQLLPRSRQDKAASARLQSQYRLTPLAAWPKGQAALPPVPTLAPNTVDTDSGVAEHVAAMDAQAFFSRFAALLAQNPPATPDQLTEQKIHALGIKAGQPFSTTVLEPETARAIQEGATRALARIVAKARGTDAAASGLWLAGTDLGRYGMDYDRRAAAAWLGLGAGLAQDTLMYRRHTDAAGQPLDGNRRYVVRFERGDLPPSTGGWSLALYDPEQESVPNPMHRYALGSLDALSRGRDGSVEIVVQHARPATAQRRNWLPAPAGPFSLTLRLRGPNGEALDGGWKPPQVRPLD
ncbi:DUF1254 domain-containing protein [Cupriavidus sp. AU9028]|nr:DUF1254 domain-containing protein [Cupriavidus sp. AU9028]